MVPELNFAYFSENTLNLTETKGWSKTELELEWKGNYVHLS